MQYSNNAVGVGVNKIHFDTAGNFIGDPSWFKNKTGFVVANCIDDMMTQDPKFPRAVQFAADINAPCIARIRVDPEWYTLAGFDMNKYDKWPSADNDPMIRAIDHQLGRDAGVKRAVHALLLDFSKYMQSDGKTWITPGWIAATGQRIIELSYKRYSLEWWPFIEAPTIAAILKQFGAGIDTWLSGAGMNYIGTFISAHPNDPAQLIRKVDVMPIPPDGYAPNSMYAKTWGFERFANTFYTFEAANGAQMPMYVYNGTVPALDDLLAFKRGTTPVPPPDNGGGGNGGTTTDYTAILNQILAQGAQVVSQTSQSIAALGQIWNKLDEHFK